MSEEETPPFPPLGDDAPPPGERVPPYVALIRIGAVIGMSVFLAFGLIFFIGGLWVAGIVSVLLSTPFFGVMRFAENMATPPNTSSDD